MVDHGYEEVKHTADLALRIWAADFHTLLIQSALGMYAMIGVQQQKDQLVTHVLRLQKASREVILVDFLNELVFLLEEEHQFYDHFIFNDEETMVAIEMKGYQVASYNRQIKAVTFHNLEIIERPQGLETTITFDI